MAAQPPVTREALLRQQRAVFGERACDLEVEVTLLRQQLAAAHARIAELEVGRAIEPVAAEPS